MIRDLNAQVVSIDTFSNGSKSDLIISWDGVLITSPLARRTAIEIRWDIRTNRSDEIAKQVSLFVSDIFRGQDNDYLVIGSSISLDGWRPVCMAQKIYLRKETGLTIEEERFLRAMRLKTVKTVQELIRIETIEQKIEENQKRRQSEYKSQLYWQAWIVEPLF